MGRSFPPLTCSDPGLPTDSAGNLVTRVATALADTLSRVGEGSTARGATRARESGVVSAFLNKRIPPGAGLAGGSSDAVATLIALNRIWDVGWSREKLRAFAAQFGSDLPFFFAAADDGSAICTGRGEVVRPTPPPDSCRWAVLALPKFVSSTPAVYRRFDEMRLGFVRETELFTLYVNVPGRTRVPGTNLCISLEMIEKPETSTSPDHVYNSQMGCIDWNRLSGPLKLRNWQPGDQYHPMGVPAAIKIKTLFQQARIPVWERTQWPVLTDAESIIWTRRFGAAAAVAAGPESSAILAVSEMEFR